MAVARLRVALAATLFMMFAGGASAKPTAAIDLPGNAVFPESLSSGPDGSLYVGSLHGGVLKVASGKASQWIAPGAYGTRSIFGVLVDAAHRRLWLCSNDLSPIGVTIASDRAGSWLVGFDLATGQGRAAYHLPDPHSFCNDMAVAADGSVFVTDTNIHVLRLRPGATALETWLSDPRFMPNKGGGLDGIAFGTDHQLYVTSIGAGLLFRIAVDRGNAGTVTQLATSRPLTRPDALRPVADNHFALADGGGQVDLVEIVGDKAEIASLDDHLDGGPTGVTVASDKTVWYVEGQLNHVFDPSLRNQPPKLPFRIAAAPIE